jgi:glycosyltransferase involved in cell wall biosynthesis
VSVIIPSYNYAQYLEERLASILRQTFHDFEIIVEDDCSTDDTLQILSRYRSRRNVTIETHSENQGVFTMWTEGLKAASGKIIWIAEEDDLCEPEFLEKLIPFFDDERVKLAYCQSSIIDDRGSIAGDYTRCFPDISESKWLRPYVLKGAEEIQEGLAVKNFVLNASGVLFLKPDVETASEILKQYRMSGDWALYLHLLKDGGFIAYSPEKLNYHRRHGASVVGQVADTNLPIEEAARIHSFVVDNYSVDKELKRRMTNYAYQLWVERNPGASLEDFRTVYPIGNLAETDAGVATSSGAIQ